jgi:hypothetical protein
MKTKKTLQIKIKVYARTHTQQKKSLDETNGLPEREYTVGSIDERMSKGHLISEQAFAVVYKTIRNHN